MGCAVGPESITENMNMLVRYSGSSGYLTMVTVSTELINPSKMLKIPIATGLKSPAYFAIMLKSKMWAISRDTHQLHYIPKHHFII